MKERQKENAVRTASLLGVDIVIGTRGELFSYASSLYGKGGAIFTPNPEILVLSCENSDLGHALSKGVNIPDGIGVRRALLSRGIITDTYPGVEIGEAILSLPGVRLGIIGGRAGVAKEAIERLIKKHTKVTEAFSVDGYSYTEDAVVSLINQTCANVVFVCLGSPKQELFISSVKDKCEGVLFLALGGSVDVYSGRVRRAPRILRKMGLEWLYRMLSSPKRILRLPRLFRFIVYDFKSRSANISKKNKKQPLFLKKSHKFDKN
jgi:N-acetylglucosaminyldiphosphoundecaprenol N-acetyl-beta-D-mannosaminyltransferase